MTNKRSKAAKSGVALLVVLFIVMVITISSIGFLSRSDVELATGRNLALRLEMDYLAESGLEHARGLILNPQDISSEYFTGATGQQLTAGNDYYDVAVVRDDSDPTDRCNYIIDCNSYRLRNSQKIGQSSLRAELRLDPCVALWTESDTSIWSGVTVNGDVYCNGGLINAGTINGDAFVNTLTGSIEGRQKLTGDLSLVWPRITVADFTSNYATQTISTNMLSGQTLGPHSPVRICYRTGDLTLAGDVQVEGMLLVDGDLAIQGTGNTVTAGKNLPAILVSGSLIVEDNSILDVTGLTVVEGKMQVNADASNVSILGGLFVKGSFSETTNDSSGSDNTGVLYNCPTWQPFGGKTNGTLEFNGDNTGVQVSTSGMNHLRGTVSLWAYAINFDGNAPLHHYLFGHTTSQVSTSWTDKIQLYTYEQSNRLFLGLGDTHNKHADIEFLDTLRWYHIAMTWNGMDYVVYVDGTPKANGSYTGLSALGSIADIGNTGNIAYRIESWHGLIDDVRIYDRVLDANDIYPPVDGLAGLVGHWKLDDSGSSVIVTAAPSRTAIILWSAAGTEEKWQQAAGAFFKTIRRQ
jgi:hypothetical protein